MPGAKSSFYTKFFIHDAKVFVDHFLVIYHLHKQFIVMTSRMSPGYMPGAGAYSAPPMHAAESE